MSDGGNGKVSRLPGSSWRTADDDKDSYSVESFYTDSTEGGGFHSSIRVNVKPSVQTEMAKLVQSGKIPEYRTTQDIVRDAIHHRLHFLAHHFNIDGLKEVMSFEIHRQNSVRLRQLLQDQAAMVAGYEESFHEALKAGDETLLRDQLELARVTLDSDVLPWRPTMRAKLAAVVEKFEREAQKL